MGRMYIAQFAAVAATVAQDLFEVLAAAEKPFKIHEVRITQDSEAGDSASEQLRFTIKRATGSYTSGSGGSSPTVNKLVPNDASTSATVEANNTTRSAAGSGALTTLLTAADNVHNGWHYLPTPECQIVFAGGSAAIIGLESTPADSITINGYIIFEELI